MAAKWRHLQCEWRGFCFLKCPSENQEKSHRISVSTQDRSNAHFRKQIFVRSRVNQGDMGAIFEALVAEIFSPVNAQESQQNQPEKGNLGDHQNKSKIRKINDRIFSLSFPFQAPFSTINRGLGLTLSSHQNLKASEKKKEKKERKERGKEQQKF